jgi:hypothetical protein
MGVVIYGSRRTTIGFDEFQIRCPACATSSYADIMIFSKYYHIYWIPMFPFEKEANVICQKCGAKQYDMPFNASLVVNFSEIKNKFRHPWYTYTGIGTFAIIVLGFIFTGRN